MEKRYLINNKIYGSSTEKPHHSAPNYIGLNWMDKLKELACDESEYNKIASHLGWKTLELNPIDITSITTVKDGKVVFKEVESECNEAIEFLDWVLSSGFYLNPHCEESRWRTIEQINSSKPMLSGGITTKQLYEIFKTRK